MVRSPKWSLAIAAAMLLPARVSAQTLPASQLTPQTLLPGTALPVFVDPLPVLDVTPEPRWAGYPKIATVTPGELAEADGPYTVKMCEFKANVLPTGTVLGGVAIARPETAVWGYSKLECPTALRDTYLGPVIVNVRNTPTSLRFVNALPPTPEASGVIAYRDSVDQTLHWADPNDLRCSMAGMEADPACFQPFRATGIPAVPHLHGGEVPPMVDGGPDAWFTSDGARQGPAYYTSAPAAANEAVYTYPNGQEQAPLWFHDHALGATRLNVYAGLAGGYYLLDPDQDVPAALKDPAQIVPVILQDRMFDTNGELVYTSASKGGELWATNPEHPYWTPEFVGDTIVVNGKVWPYLEVEQKRYRFLFLNGSNARTYELFLVNRRTNAMGPPMYVIGTDGGYVDTAVKLDPAAGTKTNSGKLVIMPGERYEVVIDFSLLPEGTRLFVKNTAKTPYPAGSPPVGRLGKVLELRVVGPESAGAPGLAYDPAATPTVRGDASKIPAIVNFATGAANVTIPPARTRQLTLNEVMGAPSTVTDPVTGELTTFPGGPLEILVNNTKWDGTSGRNDPDQPGFLGDFVNAGGKYYSELPQEGDFELWEIVNLTADAHPMHLHLTQFQLVSRQAFDVRKYSAAYAALFPSVVDAGGEPVTIGTNTCSGGLFCPGFGPPLHYFENTPAAGILGPVPSGKLGGNPDVLPFLRGPIQLPTAQEWGWKDTVRAPPRTVTRLLVRWAPTDKPVNADPASLYYPFDPSAGTGPTPFGYVWHCHIIDHEDNEMMRPDLIQLNPAAPAPELRPLVQGVAY